VAIAFGKHDKNVMPSVAKKLASKRHRISEHARLSFQPGSYADAQGQRRPMYRMTAKGMTALTMAFSGEDAEEVRIRCWRLQARQQAPGHR
jgi:Rha family phage regulatory protein